MISDLKEFKCPACSSQELIRSEIVAMISTTFWVVLCGKCDKKFVVVMESELA